MECLVESCKEIFHNRLHFQVEILYVESRCGIFDVNGYR